MKPLKSLSLLFVLVITLTSCLKEPLFGGIYGAGDNVSEVRKISGFSKIDLSISGNVYYIQDSIYYVEVSAQKNILPALATELNGNTLKIDFRRRVFRHRSITITVHSPNINGLRISGSGNIYAQNSINTDNIELKISGSGNISVSNLSTQNVHASISGSGNISMNNGNAGYAYFKISGSGDINSEYMVSDVGEAIISGSGNICANVQKSFKVNIAGSGNIKYKGTPLMDVNIKGSGKLIHID